MSEKPPSKDGSSLELDDSGIEEYRLREEQLHRERALKAEKEIKEQNRRVETLLAAEAENARPDSPLVTRKAILSAVFFFLLTYFCLLAFFDLINFLDGVRILGSEIIQGIGGTIAGIWSYRSLNRIQDSRKVDGLLWRATRAVTIGACAIVALYLLVVFFKNVPRGTPGGGQQFYAVLFVAAGVIWWLHAIRRKTLAAMKEYRSTLLETKLFLVEGLMLNLALMLIFQYLSGANVGAAVMRALLTPKQLIFIFSPLLLYFFFRKMLAGFFYH